MLSCQRCQQTSNGPQAFLLTCRGCSKTWHHRCHMPPVEDGELMQRIRATNLGDTSNDLSSWTCRRCRRGASATPSVTFSREPTVSSESHGGRESETLSYPPPVLFHPEPSPLPPSQPEQTIANSPFTDATSTAGRVASTADVRVKQELELSSGVDARPLAGTGDSYQAHSARPDILSAIPPDDDPEDLYGPPVERRVIRILPSLAEELREQQRRVAAEKEKRRAPLAPDWIFARHVHDPLWKEIHLAVGERKPRKQTARKLGDNGLNVSELVGYLTLRNSVRERKT